MKIETKLKNKQSTVLLVVVFPRNQIFLENSQVSVS
jgi:hypothetical protein